MLNRIIQPQSETMLFACNVTPERHQLSNGLTCFHVPVNASGLVRIEFMFHGGQWVQDRPLQAEMAFRLLKEGTKNYPEIVVADLLDYYGANISVRTNMSYSVLSVTCLQRHVNKVLPIVVDMLESPLYSGDKLRILLEQSRKAYEVGLHTVGERCKQLFYTSLYGPEHPMSKFPKLSDYDTLTVDDLWRYKNTYINFKNCTLWVSGTLDDTALEDIYSIVEHRNLSLGKAFDGYSMPLVHTPLEKRFFFEMPEQTFQACVRVGSLFQPRNHPDYVPMTVLSTIYGGYFGSRLMANIRERKGYTYDIRSVLYQLPHQTTFIITTETPNQYVESVINEVYSEMLHLVDTLINDTELDAVRNYMTGNLCRNYEGGLSIASRLMRLHSHGLSLSDVMAEVEIIRSITPSDLQSLAVRYLLPDKMIECVAASSN